MQKIWHGFNGCVEIVVKKKQDKRQQADLSLESVHVRMEGPIVG